MMMRVLSHFLVPSFLACCGLGCGKSATTNSPAAANPPSTPTVSAPTETTPSVKHIDAGSLALGDYLPPLDDSRIEIAPPADWRPMPRDSKYVVRFYKEARNGLPRIEVVVEDVDAEGITDVTEENLSDFISWANKQLEERGTAVLEPPIALVIGKNPCARFVSNLKLKLGDNTLLAERQSLQVSRGGRLYTINLLILPGTLLQSRDAGYAVCAGLRFLEPDTVGGKE
jgi:hypothetical protein